jgi:hypothetical protein
VSGGGGIKENGRKPTRLFPHHRLPSLRQAQAGIMKKFLKGFEIALDWTGIFQKKFYHLPRGWFIQDWRKVI